MEYSDLVAYYKKRLLERYKAIQQQERPEIDRAIALLRSSDAETLEKVVKLLEGK